MIHIKNMEYKPAISEISSYIANPVFDEFCQHMHHTYHAVYKIEYSKDALAPGWNVKFRKFGKALCVIYPHRNYFTVLIVVGNKEKKDIEDQLTTFSEYLQKLYHNTKQGNAQRWLMVDLKFKNHEYHDVLKMIDIRYCVSA